MFLSHIFEILLQTNSLSLGTIYRLSRLNSEWHYVIMHHQLLSKFKSNDLGYVKCHNIFRQIKNSTRCRECGSKNGLITNTRNNKRVYICLKCSEEKYSYNELITRHEIFKDEGHVWSKKRRIILNGLHLARVGRAGKHYYWAFQWRQPFRAMKTAEPQFN